MNKWGSWFYKLKVIFKPNESYLTLVQRLKLGKTLLPTGKPNASLIVCVCVWVSVFMPCFVFTLSQVAVVFTLLVPLCTSFLNLIDNFCCCCCCCCCFLLVLVQNWILISSCYTFCMPQLSMGKAKQTHTHTSIHTQRGHTQIYSLLRTHLLTARCQLWRARCVARICSAKSTAARPVAATASTADIAYAAAAVCGNGKAAAAFSCRTESWESNCECNIC